MLALCLPFQDLHDCDRCVNAGGSAVLSPVPKEQRDLAYWEAQFQKADKLFSAGSALEAIATHEMSLLQQATGPSTAAEGQ